MIRLEQSVLVRPELLELGLEELVFLVGYRLLVQNQDIGDVIIVNLFR